MNKIDEITNYFDELIPNPKCELEYNKPYQLVIAVMLSAQTTDKRVNIVTKELFNKYKTLEELKNADVKDIENIIRTVGSFRKKAIGVIGIAKILNEEYNDEVPNNREILESLPMVGRKSTNVILNEIYNVPTIAVDTHVDRVSKRLNLAKEDDSVLKVEEKLKRKLKKDKWGRFHHQAVLFGRYYCKAKNPLCDNCKLQHICKYKKMVK